MKKIIVIGCPGSGKTVFAEKLHKATGLPLYYLDAIWHKPDRTHITREEFGDRIQEIFAESRWIIDGNYSRTLEMRLRECDTVFLFDLSTEVCLQGTTERLGKGRYGMLGIETELDPVFKRQIEEYAENKLPEIYELLKKCGINKRIVIFKSRDEADCFINKYGNKA